jgi:hypothetical protein
MILNFTLLDLKMVDKATAYPLDFLRSFGLWINLILSVPIQAINFIKGNKVELRNVHEIKSTTKPDRFWKPVRFDSKLG